MGDGLTPTIMTANVVVIGAGVVGLSTAINIQRLVPSCSVTIVAEDVVDGTTSVGAGAIFRPTEEYLPGVDIQRARQWIRDGWEHFSSLALSEHSGPAGIAITPSFMLSRAEIKVKDIQLLNIICSLFSLTHVTLFSRLQLKDTYDNKTKM